MIYNFSGKNRQNKIHLVPLLAGQKFEKTIEFLTWWVASCVFSYKNRWESCATLFLQLNTINWLHSQDTLDYTTSNRREAVTRLPSIFLSSAFLLLFHLTLCFQRAQSDGVKQPGQGDPYSGQWSHLHWHPLWSEKSHWRRNR
jgi:hypothetical protein